MPAVIPFIPAIIAAGGSIASSLISKGGKGGSSSTPLLPAGLDHNALQGDIQSQRDLAKLFQTQGSELLGQGKDTLQKPLSYFSDILGGDRTKIMEAMAPGIAAINAQFKAPLKDAMIMGRGSALAPDLEASKQSAISNQIFQAQPAAADKLTGIAQGLMGLGVNQEQAGAGILGDATKNVLNYNAIIRGIQAQQSGQTSQMFGQLGTAFGPILKDLLKGIISPSGGGTNPSVPKIPSEVLLPQGDIDGWGGDNSNSGLNPALLSSLINLGSEKPDFAASWLDSMKKTAA